MEVIILDGDDWSGLYIDGKLVMEGHSLDLYDVIGVIGERQEVIDGWARYYANMDWLNYFASLPQNFDDVVLNGSDWEAPDDPELDWE